jgi:cardiolipin-specific phospholipase
VAERNVLSFVPHLKAPPTQTETGDKVPGEDGPTAALSGLPKTGSETVQSSDEDPYGPRRWQSELVKLSGKNRALNELSIERVGEQSDQNLVILHGYGAGLGFFYRNFEGLSRAVGWKLYALDLLGMGRSSRPPFKIHAKDRQGSITEAENWFVDSLEEWRIKRNIDRFTLLGHSLGGYMAVVYSLKYPGHLNKLILVSPVGIPEDPYAVNAAMPDPDPSTTENGISQDQGQTIGTSNPDIPEANKAGGDNNNFLDARAKAEADSGQKGNGNSNSTPAPRKPLPRWLTYLWDANISPFSLVRWTGPLGPRFVSGWTSRRFSHLPPEQAHTLHMYAYTLFKQRGSGEYALAYILAPGAFARSPLIRRIAGVGRQFIKPDGNTSSSVSEAAQRRETGLPVVFMYGQNDWMDIAGGYAAEQKLNEATEKALATATEEERRREAGSAKVVIIKDAGHHVYLEGWEDFNQVVLQEMDDTRQRELATKA